MTGMAVQGGGRIGGWWRIATWGSAALLLALPLVAMQFTAEVNWDGADFLTIGAMLVGACGTLELAARMTRNTAYRAGAAIAVVTGLVLVWINLAVGIIGTEGDPANLMYVGVLAIGIAGAIAARGRPGGMARTLTVVAVAQALVGIIALVAELGAAVVLDGLFAAAWLGSAWLFRKAAQDHGAVA